MRASPPRPQQPKRRTPRSGRGSGERVDPRLGRRFWHVAARRLRPFTVVVSLCCVAVFLIESAIPDPAALSQVGAPIRLDSTQAPTAGPIDFPYNESPTLYPNPTYLPSSGNTSNAVVFDLSSGGDSFGLVNSSSGSTGSALWFESGAYSPTLAKQIYLSGAGASSTTLPLAWSSPVEIASFAQPIVADEATVSGPTVLVAATSGGSTQVYASTTAGSSWAPLGSPEAGIVRSLSATPLEFFLQTSAAQSVTFTSDSLTGSGIGSVTQDVSGSNIIRSESAVELRVCGRTDYLHRLQRAWGLLSCGHQPD
jgi:hypothetical protein